MARKRKKLAPIHPGEILREDFLAPLKLTVNRLALDLRVPVTRMAEIVHERRGITPDTASRLARYFNTTARFWLNAQAAYDLAGCGKLRKVFIPSEARDLHFAKTQRKCRFLTPTIRPSGFGMTAERVFPQPARGCRDELQSEIERSVPRAEVSRTA